MIFTAQPSPDRSPDELSPAKATKQRLRTAFRQVRRALSDEAYAAASAAITRRVLALPELAAAETVHCYWPLLARREVDTRALITGLVARGRRVVLPVVDPAAPVPQMRHVLYRGEASLREGPWGVLEPAGGPEVAPAELDLIVVPALGAGRSGHRVGHGKGYYDLFLRDLSAFTVGLVYDACLVDAVPAEPHDVPLSAVVTPQETLRFDAAS